MSVAGRKTKNLWWIAAAASLVVAIVLGVSLWSYTSTPSEEVRLRNALVWSPEPGATFDWPGDAPPDWFSVETRAPDTDYAVAADGLGLGPLPSDVARATAIAKHLLKHPASGRGDPISSDLPTTYRLIRSQGKGYCGDFNRAFTGLALAGGLPVRSWAFSFDGYGGHGHVFNEFWDRAARRWRMVDVFMNFFPTRDDGSVLSALEFRDALLQGRTDFTYRRISDMISQPYETDAEMSAYFRRGLGEWFLLKGNTVFSADAHPLVWMARPFGRAVAQTVACIVGAQPAVCPIESTDNAAARERMSEMHRRLWGFISASAFAGIFFIVGWMRRKPGRFNEPARL